MNHQVTDHKVFYEVPVGVNHRFTGRDHQIYQDNLVKKYGKVFGLKEDGSSDKAISRYTYLSTLNMYYITDMQEDYRIFKRTFKLPVHSLHLSIRGLNIIQKLPKELLVLYIGGSSRIINFDINVIPKGIVSMTFDSGVFPFNGKDLSKLKNLKVITCDHYAVISMPKLPKDIEYISFMNSQLGDKSNPGLNGFKLSDYPNLKYFNVKYSGFKKSDIPKEWIKAKADKKIKIYY
jgi:hypothetical protein